jgi:hypothetical protein
MDDFAKSRRGAEFFDYNLPKIASQLERIANAMERKNAIEEKRLLIEQKQFRKDNLTENARVTGSREDHNKSESKNEE